MKCERTIGKRKKKKKIDRKIIGKRYMKRVTKIETEIDRIILKKQKKHVVASPYPDWKSRAFVELSFCNVNIMLLACLYPCRPVELHRV